MIIRSNRIYTSKGCQAGYLIIEDEKIKQILPLEANLTPDEDFKDLRIIPGIFDTHNHGACGFRFDESNEEQIRIALKGQAAYGVTGILPTIVNLEPYPILAKLSREFVDGAQVLGIHSEGPWGSRVGEKGINLGYPPVDLEMAKEMVRLAEGKLKLVDIAPEVENALEAIDYFISEGVTVAAFHTNANYQEAKTGIDWGITVATHLMNVMTGLHHRDVGTAGASILDDRVYCELICDGLHVCLPMVELVLKMKDHDKIMIISDNGAYLGAPVGRYRGLSKNANNDRKVIHVTEDGFVLSETGRLSGSSKPVLYGISNLVEVLKMPLEDVIKMTSLNPSLKYGFDNKGSIEVNKDADFVVITNDYKVKKTYSLGKVIFDAEKEAIPFNENFIKELKLD